MLYRLAGMEFMFDVLLQYNNIVISGYLAKLFLHVPILFKFVKTIKI